MNKSVVYFSWTDNHYIPHYGAAIKSNNHSHNRCCNQSNQVTGIEGTFRMTCEKVMQVLPENKDSLIAVLQAFIYDPLVTWKLDQSWFLVCFSAQLSKTRLMLVRPLPTTYTFFLIQVHLVSSWVGFGTNHADWWTNEFHSISCSFRRISFPTLAPESFVGIKFNPLISSHAWWNAQIASFIARAVTEFNIDESKPQQRIWLAPPIQWEQQKRFVLFISSSFGTCNIFIVSVHKSFVFSRIC